LKLLKLLKRW